MKLPAIVMGLATMTTGILMIAGVIPTPLSALPFALLGSGIGVMLAKPRA